MTGGPLTCTEREHNRQLADALRQPGGCLSAVRVLSPHANGKTDALYVVFEQEDLEEMVTEVDARLERANQLYEKNTLPAEQAEQQRVGAEQARREEAHVDLAALAARLGVPQTPGN
jgi:glycine/serine hydroxymethyltransferase